MDPTQLINFTLALLSIGFGALALLSPNFAMEALKLAPAEGRMDGKSELRGASGGAFVALGLAGAAFGPAWPVAWVMMGAHYAGAAAGRLVSFAFDGSGSRKMWLFFGIEVVFAHQPGQRGAVGVPVMSAQIIRALLIDVQGGHHPMRHPLFNLVEQAGRWRV